MQGYYFKYWTPPILPIREDNQKPASVNDYEMHFALPQFDESWETATLARGLIFCPTEGEEGGWSDWFELQLEAIRITPLLHQSIEECKIINAIDTKLNQTGLQEFINFIYEYGLNDPYLPMQWSIIDSWKNRMIDWKERYDLMADLFDASKTLKDFYTVAREKAASSRNSMIKGLLWGFVKHIEDNLILQTKLTEELKKQQIEKIRKPQKRDVNKGQYNAKRPAVCISDIECGQVLYHLINTFLSSKKKNKILIEGFLYIWIAQHAAFSGLNLSTQDILSIKSSDIDADNLTIQTSKGEIDITSGVEDILLIWTKTLNIAKTKNLFRFLTYDNLEDLLTRYTTELFGSNGRILPRDFLEKTHPMHGARITLDLRREITKQESLILNSPYRIKPQKIKNEILEAQQKIALK